MESLISTFEIDGRLLLAQAINFAIVLAILYFFAFKPLVKTMTERTDKIDKSLKNADEIEKRLALTEKERTEIINAAKKQANLIIEEASQRGEDRKNELVAKAKEEIGQVINTEKEKIARDKAETLKEIKKEVAELVVMTVEKLLNEKMTGDKDRELIKKMVK
ncbi:MAG: F0F1 ATP synthase subunit B [Patescibacteria group bacterium]|jgi:F-type H+-transporting ATPase subunit b